MTQEEKQLLLKDLCARLPYGVICHTEKGDGHLCSINQTIFGTEYGINVSAVNRDYFNDGKTDGQVIKPYLRPISNITEEERQKFEETFDLPFAAGYDTVIKKTVIYDSIIIDEGYRVEISIDTIALMLDWLLAHHFDCHNLIPKGLAIEAPKGMYKTE